MGRRLRSALQTAGGAQRPDATPSDRPRASVPVGPTGPHAADVEPSYPSSEQSAATPATVQDRTRSSPPAAHRPATAPSRQLCARVQGRDDAVPDIAVVRHNEGRADNDLWRLHATGRDSRRRKRHPAQSSCRPRRSALRRRWCHRIGTAAIRCQTRGARTVARNRRGSDRRSSASTQTARSEWRCPALAVSTLACIGPLLRVAAIAVADNTTTRRNEYADL